MLTCKPSEICFQKKMLIKNIQLTVSENVIARGGKSFLLLPSDSIVEEPPKKSFDLYQKKRSKESL